MFNQIVVKLGGFLEDDGKRRKLFKYFFLWSIGWSRTFYCIVGGKRGAELVAHVYLTSSAIRSTFHGVYFLEKKKKGATLLRDLLGNSHRKRIKTLERKKHKNSTR